ncbi:MAG: 2,4-dihydroxyhept-2-ene-1,7-dioic acid aldolase [Myxococcales bacterium]|nr:2,4-dihydroxyhept-2-ene-1,7-dioic acid aldolase [Myxococcales bacterium]
MQHPPPSLHDRLRDGRPCLGSWLSLGSPAVAELLCGIGYEFLVVDLEHTTTTLETTEAILRVVELAGVVPLVRLTDHDPALIKRVLDAGAHGIIAPMVTSRADVERLEAAMFYPPRGTRGVGLGRAQAYGGGFRQYVDSFAARAVLIPQIEHALAAERAHEILSHPAVTAYLIGPYDLSASLGVPGELTHPSVEAAVAAVLSTAKTLGVPAGYHQVEPDPVGLSARIADGYQFLPFGVDFTFLRRAALAGPAALARPE